MIPVRDVEGVLYGYLGRSTLSDSSQGPDNATPVKYLFPTGLPKSRFLFGAHELLQSHGRERRDNASQPPLRYVVIAESPFCCLKFAMWNVPCVSPFGWSLSAEQIQIVSQLARAAIYLPDRNKAAESAAVVQALGKHLWVKCPDLPPGTDDPEVLSETALRALLPKG